jgi:hypothetical protein
MDLPNFLFAVARKRNAAVYLETDAKKFILDFKVPKCTVKATMRKRFCLRC